MITSTSVELRSVSCVFVSNLFRRQRMSIAGHILLYIIDPVYVNRHWIISMLFNIITRYIGHNIRWGCNFMPSFFIEIFQIKGKAWLQLFHPSVVNHHSCQTYQPISRHNKMAPSMQTRIPCTFFFRKKIIATFLCKSLIVWGLIYDKSVLV